jgi:hypothetical protein
MFLNIFPGSLIWIFPIRDPALKLRPLWRKSLTRVWSSVKYPHLFSNKEMSLLGEVSWLQWRLFAPTWKPCRDQSPLQRKSLRYCFESVIVYRGSTTPMRGTYYELVLCFRWPPFLLTVIPVLVISSGKDSDISLFDSLFIVFTFRIVRTRERKFTFGKWNSFHALLLTPFL